MSRTHLAVVTILVGCSRDPTGLHLRSTELPTIEQRVRALCDVSLCPTRPLDAAFTFAPHAEGGTVVHAIVKVDPRDVSQWAMGCDNVAVEARPKWVSEVLPAGWALKTVPDRWQCGAERRVIHVKEGLIIRALWKRD